MRGYLVPTDEDPRTRVYETGITGAGPAPPPNKAREGQDGPEHQDNTIELDRVALGHGGEFLRAYGLSAGLFDKVKRPELDGHYTAAPLCGARQKTRPFVNFAGLAQSAERPSRKGQARCSIHRTSTMLPVSSAGRAAALKAAGCRFDFLHGAPFCWLSSFGRAPSWVKTEPGGSKPSASTAPVVQSAETRRSDRRWWVFESPPEHQSRV